MRFSNEVSESLKKPYLKFINKFCKKAEEGVFDPELMKAIREIAHIRQMAVSTALAAAPLFIRASRRWRFMSPRARRYCRA
jgi:hypothetical protein